MCSDCPPGFMMLHLGQNSSRDVANIIKIDGSWDKKIKCVGAGWFLTSSNHHQPLVGVLILLLKMLHKLNYKLFFYVFNGSLKLV